MNSKIGVRAMKRKETLRRIAEAGMTMFLTHGYAHATLDAIADAAGISRRTFFYYFKSKEDVLLAHEGSGFSMALCDELRKETARSSPFEAAKVCMIRLAHLRESKDSVAIDRLLSSTPRLRARKSGLFTDLEAQLAETMAELWPHRPVAEEHRLAAMAATGVLRISLEDWRLSAAAKPLAAYLSQHFDAVDRIF